MSIIFPFASATISSLSIWPKEKGVGLNSQGAARRCGTAEPHPSCTALNGDTTIRVAERNIINALKFPNPPCQYFVQQHPVILCGKTIIRSPLSLHLLHARDMMHQKDQTRTGSKPMQGQRMVFRVPNYKSNNALTHGSSESTEQVYHSRRAHRKSRSGCANCKQRRVKVSHDSLSP
jgi:hypothetical protein